MVFADPGGIGHFVGFAAEDLDGEGAFVGVDDEFFVRLFGLVVERMALTNSVNMRPGPAMRLAMRRMGRALTSSIGARRRGGLTVTGPTEKPGGGFMLGGFLHERMTEQAGFGSGGGASGKSGGDAKWGNWGGDGGARVYGASA